MKAAKNNLKSGNTSPGADGVTPGWIQAVREGASAHPFIATAGGEGEPAADYTTMHGTTLEISWAKKRGQVQLLTRGWTMVVW